MKPNVVLIFLLSLFSHPSMAQERSELYKAIETQVDFLWAQLSFEDYLRLLEKGLDTGEEPVSLTQDDFVPHSAPQYRELSALLDRMDSAFRNQFSNRLRNIPRPRVEILRHPKHGKRPNAFVMTKSFCLNAPLVWDVETARNRGMLTYKEDDYEYRDQKRLMYLAGSTSPHGETDLMYVAEPCPRNDTHSLSADELRKIVGWWNNQMFDRSKTQCELRVQENLGDIPMAVVMGQDCRVADSDLRHVSYGSRYTILRKTISTITVHSGLFETLDSDDSIAAILGHELVHYYLAHGVRHAEKEDYFYSLEETRRLGHHPRKVPRYERLGKSMIALDDIFSFARSYERIAGPRWPSEIHRMASSVFRDLCSPQDEEDSVGSNRPKSICPPSCKLASETTEIEVGSKYLVIPESAYEPYTLEETEIAGETLADYEKHIIECVEQLEILPHSFAIPTQPAFLSGANALRDLQSGSDFIVQCTGGFPEFSGDLLAFFDQIAQRILENNCTPQAVRSEVSKLPLGYFTQEQEADELALELLSLAQIPQESMLNMSLAFAAYRDDPGCSKWLKKQKGRNVPLLEDYGDTHHDTCFRWDNLRRQLGQSEGR